MPPNPYSQFNFLLEIEGTTAAGFTEVSGMNTETDPIEYREGSDLSHMRKMPGLTKYGNITLKRGYTQSHELWEWRKTTIDGVTARKNGAVILLDEERNPALRWEFFEAWINKYEGPGLNSSTNEAAIESIEFVVERWHLV
ncbi:MAG: phage tail protein [Acidimicrobiia bacterium]